MLMVFIGCTDKAVVADVEFFEQGAELVAHFIHQLQGGHP